MPPRKKQQLPHLQTHRIPVVNASDSTAIPAFGLVRATGTDAQGTTIADQPNADGQDVYVNGPLPIPPSGYGVVSKDWPLYAAYTGGPPTVGQTWGAASGSYLLTSGKSGFLIQGAPNTVQQIVLVSSTAAAAGTTTTYTASSSRYFNGALPSGTLTTCTFNTITLVGAVNALQLSGSNLQIIASGTYRWWFTVRWQYNPVVAGNYGAWMTRNAPSGSPPFASSYDAGSLTDFAAGSGGVPNVPNPGVTVGGLVYQMTANQLLYFQLYQDTGQAVIVDSFAWAEKVA
jgi:hypothetical protein